MQNLNKLASVNSNVEMKSINILIVDDHSIIRDGIISILKNVKDIQIKGEANNAKETLDLITTNEFDVIVLDISIPDMSGLELISKIKQENPKIKILILSMHESKSYIMNAIERGALGYLTKSVDKEELVNAIRKVYGNEYFFCSNSSNIIMDEFLTKIKPQKKLKDNGSNTKPNLTRRELEILSLIKSEFNNHEIARKLFISPRTVDVHRRNLLNKLKAKNTAGLISKAFLLGYFDKKSKNGR